MEEVPKITFNSKSPRVKDFEIIELEKFNSIKRLQVHDPSLPHKVDFYAIIFYLDGSKGQHFVDFKEYNVTKGSLVFIAKEQIQAFGKDNDKKGYMILFTHAFLERSLLSSQLLSYDRLFNFHLYEPLIQISDHQHNRIKSIFDELYFEFMDAENPPSEQILSSLFQVLILRSDRYKTTDNGKLHTKYYREFANFQILLHKYASYYRNVKFYSDELQMSVKKLNHITKSVANQSTKDYINNYIILLIKRSLINTNMNVKELSFHFHFDEPTNFVKFFKKYVGETPNSFQNKQLNKS